MGRPKDCLSEATLLATNSEEAWFSTFLQLEISSCHAFQGESLAAIAHAKLAATAAQRANLPVIGLRASGFLSTYDSVRGALPKAWQEAESGLSECSEIRDDGMRRYQFLNTLVEVASAVELRWTAAGLADAASTAAHGTKNLQITAYAFEVNGIKQLAVGANTAAADSFAIADTTLARLGDGTAARTYRKDWQTDRAPLTVAQHGAAPVLAQMSSSDQQFRGPDAIFPKIKFDTEYADLLRQAKRSEDAVAKAQEAVDESERLLLTADRDRLSPAWQNQTDRAYRVLVLALSENGRPYDALAAWEWYRGAGYRTPSTASVRSHGRSSIAAIQHVLQPSVNHLTLVVARLQDRYIGWSVLPNSSVVRMQTLSDSPELLQEEVQSFRRLCSDPNSSLQDISTLGRALDHDLLAPFADQIDGANVVQLDLDGSLAELPFAAIQHNGKFLGETHPLLFLPAGWSVASTAVAEERSTSHPRVLLVRGEFSSNEARIPEQYDESEDIASAFAGAHIQNALLHRSGPILAVSGLPAPRLDLSSTEIMHYVGHGLSDNAEINAPSTGSVILKAKTLSHCRLAVLAACRTLDQRENAADNVSSFAHILLVAGAGRVIASQWDVDSRMTHKLMARLYTELADHQTIGESLHRAQRALQATPAAAHPYYWAAFQLIGQPSPTRKGSHP